MQALLEGVGKTDHIVYTAGDPLTTKPLSEVSLPQMQQTGMVRFYVPLIIAKHAPNYLTGGLEYSNTLTAGAACERPVPNWTVISAYLGGLQAMMHSLTLNLKPIRVNLVSPGAVDTELWSHIPVTMRAEIFKERAAALPTSRMGQVQDVAEAYIYAMKDQNITGNMLSTNGGHLPVG